MCPDSQNLFSALGSRFKYYIRRIICIHTFFIAEEVIVLG